MTRVRRRADHPNYKYPEGEHEHMEQILILLLD
jgi:hypothetical protein